MAVDRHALDAQHLAEELGEGALGPAAGALIGASGGESSDWGHAAHRGPGEDQPADVRAHRPPTGLEVEGTLRTRPPSERAVAAASAIETSVKSSQRRGRRGTRPCSRASLAQKRTRSQWIPGSISSNALSCAPLAMPADEVENPAPAARPCGSASIPTPRQLTGLSATTAAR